MKVSTIIKRAEGHHDEYVKLLRHINEQLQELLEDDCAHVFTQTDGLCVAWGEGLNNSCLSAREIEDLLKGSREDALEILESKSI